jgi:hypothetical protein
LQALLFAGGAGQVRFHPIPLRASFLHFHRKTSDSLHYLHYLHFLYNKELIVRVIEVVPVVSMTAIKVQVTGTSDFFQPPPHANPAPFLLIITSIVPVTCTCDRPKRARERRAYRPAQDTKKPNVSKCRNWVIL